ncbi:MAG: DUF2804 family protein, partial [Spirochaetales bacterium]|nr:DUF2804 family protein [Spirochaetales bacterium]
MPAESDSDERPPYGRSIVDPPDHIVRDGTFVLGCFNGPPGKANMLDVERPYHYPVPRWVKDFRCKEWVAFQFGNERWFFFTALYEAKSVGLAQFSAWDREREKILEFRRIVPLGRFGIGEALDGKTLSCSNRRQSLQYSFDISAGSMTVQARMARHGTRPAFDGAFTFAFNTRQTAASAVCLPLGLNRAMYSTKVLMPMRGWFDVGGERTELDGPDSMGIIDDHKGYYPYRMR